jgi:hypothetical protein
VLYRLKENSLDKTLKHGDYCEVVDPKSKTVTYRLDFVNPMNQRDHVIIPSSGNVLLFNVSRNNEDYEKIRESIESLVRGRGFNVAEIYEYFVASKPRPK